MLLLVFLCLFSRLLGYTCSAIIGSLPFYILVTCSNHVSLLFLILSTIVSFCSIFSRIISLRILSRLNFPSIFPSASSFLLPVASFHPSSSDIFTLSHIVGLV